MCTFFFVNLSDFDVVGLENKACHFIGKLVNAISKPGLKG